LWLCEDRENYTVFIIRFAGQDVSNFEMLLQAALVHPRIFFDARTDWGVRKEASKEAASSKLYYFEEPW